MLVKAVVEESRKTRVNSWEQANSLSWKLMKFCKMLKHLFKMPLVRTFSAWSGDKNPDEIKRILFLSTGHVHERITLFLIYVFRQKQLNHYNSLCGRRDRCRIG